MPDHRVLIREDGPVLVLVDTKYRGPCRFNPAWTARGSQNLLAILRAVGLFPGVSAQVAASALYEDGRYEGQSGSVILCSIAESSDENLRESLPGALQWTWDGDILPFIFTRIHDYHAQKANVQQWDGTGLALKDLALKTHLMNQFLTDVHARMIN